jgi:hypothetical protein
MKITLSNMLNKTPRFLVFVLGFAIAAIGLVSFLSGVVGWYTMDRFLWLSFVYSAMNALLAYGILHFRRWVVPVLSLNAGALGILFLAQWLTQSLLPNAIPLIFASALALFAILARRQFATGPRYEAFPCTAFLFFWLISMSYNCILIFKIGAF